MDMMCVRSRIVPKSVGELFHIRHAGRGVSEKTRMRTVYYNIMRTLLPGFSKDSSPGAPGATHSRPPLLVSW